MGKFQEKAQAQVKKMVGQMIRDEKLFAEGKEQQQRAENPHGRKSRETKQVQAGPKDPKRKGKAPSSSRKKSDVPTKRRGPVLE